MSFGTFKTPKKFFTLDAAGGLAALTFGVRFVINIGMFL